LFDVAKLLEKNIATGLTRRFDITDSTIAQVHGVEAQAKAERLWGMVTASHHRL
jgi:hypothetical protein